MGDDLDRRAGWELEDDAAAHGFSSGSTIIISGVLGE